MVNVDEQVQEVLAERREACLNMGEDELLLNAFEYACCAVVAGADPDSKEFSMYAMGKRMILDAMKAGS
jgi:hypothetical protein